MWNTRTYDPNWRKNGKLDHNAVFGECHKMYWSKMSTDPSRSETRPLIKVIRKSFVTQHKHINLGFV